MRCPMIFLFPILGIILSALTVILNGTTGSEALFDGIVYSLEYTIILILALAVLIVTVSLFVDLKKPNIKFSKFYNAFAGFILKIALSACNVKVKVEGEEKIPKGRFLLIQNHKAMFDPVVSIAYLWKYEIGYVTKPENFNLPIINKFMHRVCCISIDRENARNAVKTINAAAENIQNDVCSMGIYPEGTRARDCEMLPFHAGSFKIATKSGAPIVVTTVDNTNLVHRNAPFKRTDITLRICGVISAEEVASLSTNELSAKARKLMCDSLGVDCE